MISASLAEVIRSDNRIWKRQRRCGIGAKVLVHDPDGQVCPNGKVRPKWPIEVVGSGGEFQLDCPSPIEPMLVNAWNHRSQVKGCGMLPLEPVSTHTYTTRVPETLTCTIHKVGHVQPISAGSHSHTHNPDNPYMHNT